MSSKLKIPRTKLYNLSHPNRSKGIYEFKNPLQIAGLFRIKNTTKILCAIRSIKGTLEYSTPIYSQEEKELLINAVSILEYVKDNINTNWTLYKQENNLKTKKELKEEEKING